MKNALVVDIHKTLLLENGKPNKYICDILKCLSDKYAIVLYTADDMENFDKEEINIAKCNIQYSGLYYKASDKNDIEKKKSLLDKIEEKFKICGVIDNNKKVCKYLKKYYSVLRYMI